MWTYLILPQTPGPAQLTPDPWPLTPRHRTKPFIRLFVSAKPTLSHHAPALTHALSGNPARCWAVGGCCLCFPPCLFNRLRWWTLALGSPRISYHRSCTEQPPSLGQLKLKRALSPHESRGFKDWTIWELKRSGAVFRTAKSSWKCKRQKLDTTTTLTLNRVQQSIATNSLTTFNIQL